MLDLEGKHILITGGTGSFGKAFVRHVLDNFELERLIILSRDELKQAEMKYTFSPDEHPCLGYFTGNIREKNRLHRAFGNVDFIVYSAALKRVPAVEYNPMETIKTNVAGGSHVVDIAIDRGVDRVIALSTEKGANPVNLYGATKLCSDKLFLAGNHYSGKKGTSFSIVRYGNVVGSRGSFIPFFLKKRSTGVLPITAPRMTRFWLTLKDAVQFVLQSLFRMKGGEVFVPKIPSIKITDLSRAIAPDCEHREVRIRPGEKLHEVMIPKKCIPAHSGIRRLLRDFAGL
jgi:UDP-N-acetylglucosamine 4,6-dehydratase